MQSLQSAFAGKVWPGFALAALLLYAIFLGVVCYHRALIPATPFEQAKAEARRNGIPLQAAELQAALPPEDQNAAPLYTRLTTILTDHPLSKEDQAVENLLSRSMPSKEMLEKARKA